MVMAEVTTATESDIRASIWRKCNNEERWLTPGNHPTQVWYGYRCATEGVGMSVCLLAAALKDSCPALSMLLLFCSKFKKSSLLHKQACRRLFRLHCVAIQGEEVRFPLQDFPAWSWTYWVPTHTGNPKPHTIWKHLITARGFQTLD